MQNFIIKLRVRYIWSNSEWLNEWLRMSTTWVCFASLRIFSALTIMASNTKKLVKYLTTIRLYILTQACKYKLSWRIDVFICTNNKLQFYIVHGFFCPCMYKTMPNVIAQYRAPSVTVGIMITSNFGNGSRIAKHALVNAPSTKRMESMNILLAHVSEKHTDSTN